MQTGFQKSIIPAMYVLPKSLLELGDDPVYGREICKSIEMVTGEYSVECVQKVDGKWRLTVKTKGERASILQHGLSIRGHSVQVLGRSPTLINGEESVRLMIANVPYEVSDEEIRKALAKLQISMGAEIHWENYQDESKKWLKAKTGRRYVFMQPPDKPLPNFVSVAGRHRAYLSYKGQKAKEKEPLRGSVYHDDKEEGNETSGSPMPTDRQGEPDKNNHLASAPTYIQPNVERLNMSVAVQAGSGTNLATNTDSDGGLISANPFAALAVENNENSPDQDAIDMGILPETSKFSLNKPNPSAEDSAKTYPVGSDPQSQTATPVVGIRSKTKKSSLIEGQMRLESFNMRSSRSLDRKGDRSRKGSNSAKRSINHSDKSPNSTNSPNKKQKHAGKASSQNLDTTEEKDSGLQPSTSVAGSGKAVGGGSTKINANADFDWYNLKPLPCVLCYRPLPA